MWRALRSFPANEARVRWKLKRRAKGANLARTSASSCRWKFLQAHGLAASQTDGQLPRRIGHVALLAAELT